MTNDSLPRLCFLGHMLGRNPGYITTQGQIVADLFRAAGYPVISASSSLRRYQRFTEIALTLIRKRSAIDIVCLEVYGGLSFLIEDTASLLSRLFRIPLIMILHGGDLPHFIARYPGWAGRVLRRAKLLVAPSPFLAEAVRPYGLRVELIPNVIDLAEYPFCYREKVRPRLFWMRTFHEAYNPLMAVQALALIRQTLPEACLAMAGPDKGLQTATQRLAARLGVADAVTFPGFLDQRGKIQFFTEYDIFINTNTVDNMPVSIVEAGAMGMPIISTEVGGIPYLLKDGENGLLIADGDARAMANAVRRLVNDPALAGRLSRAGRALAERSGWGQVRPQWERAFAQLKKR